MSTDTLFCHLSSTRIAELIRSAEAAVCYAGPGIQREPALAMLDVARRIGPELLTVSLDFDERVMRMGYGDVEAVKKLRAAGIRIDHAPGLRSALLIVDREGYTFTPTPLYLEAESQTECARNALRLSPEQVTEALARLSPAGKAIALAQANDLLDRARIESLPVEVGSAQVTEAQFEQVNKSLKIAPPVKFDLARQVRVFEPYLQYVELRLTGAAIQRHRFAIPPEILELGGSKDLEGRLRTTFELIEKSSNLSSKELETKLKKIRDDLTHSLGKQHGRIVLKSAKPRLQQRLDEFREELRAYRERVERELQDKLDQSRQQIIDYYLPQVLEEKSDALIGRSASSTPTKDDAHNLLNEMLQREFPTAEALIHEMTLDEHYKDVTYETLNRDDFLKALKVALPNLPWDKAHEEFRAAGEHPSTPATRVDAHD